ncbi:MAG: nucleotidyltransferase family protein [Flavobacteriales bacterium]|jgi:predicted nucleotidyltransferase
MTLLQKHQEDIRELCKKYKVKTLYAFGSVLTDQFNDRSDMDLIVDFANVKLEDYGDNYFDFKFSLEDTLNRKIDLLESQAIKNPYFLNHINQRRMLIYGQ